MGRSTQEKALENRARIVDRANALFRQRGVDNVSVSDVMGACGMTVGGFYKHFDSKDALVAQACGLAFTQALKAWDEVYENADTNARERNLELVRRYINNRSPERRCPILAFAPHVATGDAAGPAVRAYQAGIHELFEKFVEGAGTEGEPPVPAASREAMALFAAMVGARVLNQAAGNAGWVRDIEDAVIAAAASLSPKNEKP
ncbi:TetR/AcrR family transcriptional regulator [Alicycliphilus denitrificans]|uniref:Regulatory protein TetR n=2 Tax=Alicycliphilus denitrificans TaxID=179636 RepID=F4GD73_ALIDK|nr:TetR/AcrR family transcriptional regulator [Alicycliphilus denitrificans]GAO22174.1 TetR family transcriptional regulator [Alicycliphilus sp. B1]HRP21019.1 TetR/AcrR family transcriptional regulator [Alicycliphilus sp.]ADV00015.1 regulatory protein TetR [Alicycliphilus denitrificans BC]AEB84832.1 regulatory protein TetR [Alicycliphilus denitrificans K601]QKD44196.1 TetR/AcrR family transcriptional regulator [Alicycliphilus denitrificans]